MCEVVKSNFEDVFPQIEEAIANSEFIAIDSEFSGLAVSRDESGSLFDDGAARYNKLRQSISQFTLTQIGLSAFLKDKSADNTYVAHSFNCYLYPHAFGLLDTRFLCQASSWQFMCRYQFDFNKFVYEGISFLNEDQERLLSNHLTSPDSLYSDDRITDERLLQNCCSRVAEWLSQADGNSSMELEIPDGIADYSVLVEIRLRFPLLWTEIVSTKQVRVYKVTSDERASLETRHMSQEKTRILNQMLGFTRVFRVMLAHKKPLLGHNNLMDLMFMYEKFYRPLPTSYASFKSELHSLFPVVIDTKHIVSCMRRPYESCGLFENTGLSELYKSLDSSNGRLYSMCSPTITHTEKHERYKSNHCPHEAGYDAYMCGYVFLRIAHIIASDGTRPVDARAIPFRSMMSAVSPYVNCVNLIRASIDSLRLDGPDPPSRQPPWLHVKACGRDSMLSVGYLSRLLSPFGSVDIQVQNSRQALVAVRSHKAAKDILKSFSSRRDMKITYYSSWRHSLAAKSAFWTGLALSGSLCVWVLWSAVRPRTQ